MYHTSRDYYFDRREGYSPCEMDIFDGKIRIYSVPFAYRTKGVYLDAYSAVSVIFPYPEQESQRKLEHNLIKTQIYNDIIKSEELGMFSNADALRNCYTVFEDLDEMPSVGNGLDTPSSEDFLDFLNRKTSSEGCRLCRLDQWGVKDNVRLAFLLADTYIYLPSYTYSYTLYGYLSNAPQQPVFRGEFSVHQVQSPENKTQYLNLDSFYVKYRELRGKGIGTAAMDIIKDIARQQKCGIIVAHCRVLDRTSSKKDRLLEENTLLEYFKKNGYEQSTDSNKVVYAV